MQKESSEAADPGTGTVLVLGNALTVQIRTEGEHGYPDEICGILVGQAQNGRKIVTRLFPIENVWEAAAMTEFSAAGIKFTQDTRRRRFAISQQAFYEVDKAARAAGESILGFYHTHPDHPARPSAYDLQLAQEIFPGYSYIILSVHQGVAGEMTSWVLQDDYSAFHPESLVSS